MTDRLQQALDELDLTARRLGRRARADLEEAYAPAGQSYEASVSGSGGTSTTELAGLDAIADVQTHSREARMITRELEKAANLLASCEKRLAPPDVGGQCPTVARHADSDDLVRCTGEISTHAGLCDLCAGDWRTRAGLEIPATVIAQRNRRRTVKCGCHHEHDHEPGVCLRDLEPGQTIGMCRECREYGRTPTCKCGPECCPDGCTRPQEHGQLSETCKKRRDRARARARANANGATANHGAPTDDGAHPWGWNAPK